MSQPKKIALVTGGNKGIGLAICRALASSTNPRVHVLLGSRDAQRGQQAVQQLQAEGKDNVESLPIDISDESSIAGAAKAVRERYGGLDILVNNAGIATKGDAFDEHVARTTLDTNYYGTRNAYRHFAPLLRPHARVVNVSSMSGRSAMRHMSEERRQQLLAKDLTEQQLDALMEQFVSDVKEGKWKERGWPNSAYGTSKAGVTMLTRIHARDQKDNSILVNCCCPGWVRTDMTSAQAPKSVEEGAVTPVKLALLPETEKTTGRLWEDEQVREFV